jgi:hypothetical protein
MAQEKIDYLHEIEAEGQRRMEKILEWQYQASKLLEADDKILQS